LKLFSFKRRFAELSLSLARNSLGDPETVETGNPHHRVGCPINDGNSRARIRADFETFFTSLEQSPDEQTNNGRPGRKEALA
jgi:hypothetical protein